MVSDADMPAQCVHYYPPPVEQCVALGRDREEALMAVITGYSVAAPAGGR